MTVCEEDVHDRDPVRQGHVSAFPFTPFAIASESFAGQLCLLSALTLGRFASSLCLCQQGLAGTGHSQRRDSQALFLTSSGLLPLMICSLNWDPGDPEHSATTNSMPKREPCAHSSKISTVSSGQFPPTPRILRQSYTLMRINIVYMEFEIPIPDDKDSGHPEQSDYSNSMPDRDTRTQFDVFYRLFWSI